MPVFNRMFVSLKTAGQIRRFASDQSSERKREEYCSYLSKKLAELFGADPAGVRESEYLPFLDDFGDLFVAKEKRFFPYLVYKRPVYRYVRFRRTSAAYSNLNRADLASLVAHVNHQLKGGYHA